MPDAGNTDRTTPPEDERARMKAEHAIAWHPRGGWCRKFPGDANRTYFGKVPAPLAVRKMIDEENRRKAVAKGDAAAVVRLTNLTVSEAVDLYLIHLDREYDAGNMGVVQRARYGSELSLLVAAVGKRRHLADLCKLTAPEAIFRPLRDKALARGIFAAEKHVIQVRTFLDWCSTSRRFIPAPFYGEEFNAPSEKEKRAKKKAVRKAKGAATWEPAEVRQIVEAARLTDVHRHAQVLLMLNGGMGATDLSHLTDADVDWDRRCIHTDRSKTLVPRVVPLWDTTLAAMRASRAARPAPADPVDADRFFLTKHGRPLVVETLAEGRQKIERTDAIRNWFFRLLNAKPRKKWKAPAQRLPGLKRHRAGGYTLRSCFAVLAKGYPGGDPDLPAIIMGHKLSHPVMQWYLRGDLRSKLEVVTSHVYLQLWPENQTGS